MQAVIHPSPVNGNIHAAASKSSMQRACAAAFLHAGTTVINNPGNSNDDLAALKLIEDLGASIRKSENHITVTSAGIPETSVKTNSSLQVNCGESGLGIRMFAPIIALSNELIIVNGEGSLLNRPMNFFDEVFPTLGVFIESNKGKLPLKIKGPLKPVDIEIDGSLSSQFLTGLLLAYAASGADNVTITVNNLKSRPYIDLTIQVMNDFGWQVQNNNYKTFYFSGNAVASKEDILYKVEGDWSGGAFLLVAGAIAGKINVEGLNINSSQADKAILEALHDAGADLSIVNDDLIEIGPGSLKAFEFDATDCPDLFPPLVALAAYCEGTTIIRGANRLTHKESNRALTLQEEFAKMGVVISLDSDLMMIKGAEEINGATVHSRHDHRIAMACAVAGLNATGPVTIEEAGAVSKSYPDFYDHLRQLGAKLETNNLSIYQ